MSKRSSAATDMGINPVGQVVSVASWPFAFLAFFLCPSHVERLRRGGRATPAPRQNSAPETHAAAFSR